MRPNVRLGWSGFIVLGSIIYCILVIANPDIASALMLGYVGILLTVFFVNEVWKKT
jgi:hypothetical protein